MIVEISARGNKKNMRKSEVRIYTVNSISHETLPECRTFDTLTKCTAFGATSNVHQ